jgi:hypothetical protein
MRKSTAYILVTAFGVLLFIGLMLHARADRKASLAFIRTDAGIVRDLQLTDLCLFTEARYTRHPAMADLHAPFQDHPMALEHFPSGSLVTPPRFLREAP